MSNRSDILKGSWYCKSYQESFNHLLNEELPKKVMEGIDKDNSIEYLLLVNKLVKDDYLFIRFLEHTRDMAINEIENPNNEKYDPEETPYEDITWEEYWQNESANLEFEITKFRELIGFDDFKYELCKSDPNYEYLVKLIPGFCNEYGDDLACSVLNSMPI